MESPPRCQPGLLALLRPARGGASDDRWTSRTAHRRKGFCKLPAMGRPCSRSAYSGSVAAQDHKRERGTGCAADARTLLLPVQRPVDKGRGDGVAGAAISCNASSARSRLAAPVTSCARTRRDELAHGRLVVYYQNGVGDGGQSRENAPRAVRGPFSGRMRMLGNNSSNSVPALRLLRHRTRGVLFTPSTIDSPRPPSKCRTLDLVLKKGSDARSSTAFIIPTQDRSQTFWPMDSGGSRIHLAANGTARVSASNARP